MGIGETRSFTSIDDWFTQASNALGRTIFNMSDRQEQNQRVVDSFLSAAARQIVSLGPPFPSSLFAPLVRLLCALKLKLDLEDTFTSWKAAIENLVTLQERIRQLKERSEAVAELVPDPVPAFFELLRDSLLDSGVVLGHQSILNDENRKIALQMAWNWGTRLLVAFAREEYERSKGEEKPGTCAWLGKQVSFAQSSLR